MLVIAATGAACWGSSASSTVAKPLATGIDHVLTVTPAQMLSATGGATPVTFGNPANGKLTYGPAGMMVYTPNTGYSGTGHFQVTTTDAVKLSAADTRQSRLSVAWRYRAAPTVRVSRRSPERRTRSTV